MVAVISDNWWRTRFGASPAAIGSTVHLNGSVFSIVGVAPPTCRGSYDAVMLLVVAALTSHLPARRTTKIDPAATLTGRS